MLVTSFRILAYREKEDATAGRRQHADRAATGRSQGQTEGYSEAQCCRPVGREEGGKRDGSEETTRKCRLVQCGAAASLQCLTLSLAVYGLYHLVSRVFP
jgi:hypothetical protein